MLVELEQVHFAYGQQPALRGVNLQFGEGRIGLLGPNGAGKSTLLRILLGLLRPTRGSGHVLGCPLAQLDHRVRRYIGYMPESECLIPGLSGVEYVALAGILSGLAIREAWRHAHRVLDLLGLEEARYRRLEEYSTGMKQRLKLAQALVHRPRLLLLDEPTAGLDPPGRDALLDLLVSLSQELGVSVILSTHHLADVERVCEYVVVLHQGQVRAQGRLEQLRQPTPQQYWLQVFGPLEPLLEALRSHHAMILEVDGQPGIEKTVSLSAAALASTPAEALRDGPAQHAQPQPAKHTLLVRVPNDWPMWRFFELAQAHQCVVQQLVPDTTTPWSEWFGPP